MLGLLHHSGMLVDIGRHERRATGATYLKTSSRPLHLSQQQYTIVRDCSVHPQATVQICELFTTHPRQEEIKLH